MKARRGKRTEHGTRKWILKAIKSAGGTQPMRTAEIRKRVAQLNGKRIPDHSLYQALRTLVRQKVVRARRVGREFSYHISAEKQAAPATRPATRTAAPKVQSARPLSKPDAEAGRELHKLAMGDIVILKIGDTFVEVATNLNGRLVLERHARPS